MLKLFKTFQSNPDYDTGEIVYDSLNNWTVWNPADTSGCLIWVIIGEETADASTLWFLTALYSKNYNSIDVLYSQL